MTTLGPSMVPHLLAILTLVAAAATVSTHTTYPRHYVAAKLVKLNDNGAWSWFMDPRDRQRGQANHRIGPRRWILGGQHRGSEVGERRDRGLQHRARDRADGRAAPASRAGRPRRAGVLRTEGVVVECPGMCDGFVHLVMLLVLCCGMRCEGRGGPAPCLLGDGGSDDPTTSTRRFIPLSGRRAAAVACVSIPSSAETNP